TDVELGDVLLHLLLLDLIDDCVHGVLFLAKMVVRSGVSGVCRVARGGRASGWIFPLQPRNACLQQIIPYFFPYTASGSKALSVLLKVSFAPSRVTTLR